ncbi:hypothetical protein ACP3TY_06090 [Pseudomonas rustica]|uniref:hypothetical protein n=1 Tax=Pseudomonas rustica TaxID=2827099 RepID=UPI003CECF131
MPESIIYLDSNDYSALSKMNLSESEALVRSSLLSLKASGRAVFAFSGAHISEMAPLDQAYADAAIRRTGLLKDLCERNAMISFDRLIKAELESLIALRSDRIHVMDTNGQWFPEFGALVSPLDSLDISGTLNKQAQDASLNRKERRALKATTLSKSGNFRSNISHIGKPNLDEFIETFPMRPKDAQVLHNYVMGKASRKKADEALLESLRDPTYMTQWFREHHHKLGAIGEWVRRPAQNLIKTIEANLEDLRNLLISMPADNRATTLSSFNNSFWVKTQNKGILDIVNKLLTTWVPGAPACRDISLVDQYCPGLSTCLRGVYRSVRNSFGTGTRVMKHSDFVDAIHALYVPYVTFFRADAYMASILQPLAKRFGTQVHSSTGSLVKALEVIS